MKTVEKVSDLFYDDIKNFFRYICRDLKIL